MMKSNLINFMILNYPMLINSMIMMIMIMSYKNNKYHPMLLMTILILLTILISIKMNIMHKSWINFILFLIMIGGLLVIYMYVTSLINNKNLYIDKKNIKLIMLKLMIMMLMLYFTSKNLSNINLYLNSQELMTLNFNFFEKKNELLMNELFHYNKYPMMFIMLYLYYSMMCIMNICYKIKIPLRQLFLYE